MEAEAERLFIENLAEDQQKINVEKCTKTQVNIATEMFKKINAHRTKLSA